MAVAFDAKASAIYNGTVSSGGQLNFTNHTVGVGSNRALEVSIVFLTSDPGTVTVIWDPGGANQSLTLIDSYIDSTNFSNKPVRLDKWGLAAPVSGNKTLQLNCSAGRFTAIMDTVSVTGANQSGGAGTFRNATHAEDITGASNIASVTVTSDTSSLIIAQYYAELSNTFGSLSNNSVYTATNSTAAAAENYVAGFPSATMTGALTAFGKWMAQGVSIAAPGGLLTDGAVLGGASALVASSNQIYSNAASLNAAAVLVAAASQRMVSKAQFGGSGSLFGFATILGAPIQWSDAAQLSGAASLAVASSRLILAASAQLGGASSLSANCLILQIPKVTHSDPSYTGANAAAEIMVTSGLNDTHMIGMSSGTFMARVSPGYGPPDFITAVAPLALTQAGLTIDPAGGMCSVVGSPPANSTAPGLPGQIAQDGAGVYICYAANKWVKLAGTFTF